MQRQPARHGAHPRRARAFRARVDRRQRDPQGRAHPRAARRVRAADGRRGRARVPRRAQRRPDARGRRGQRHPPDLAEIEVNYRFAPSVGGQEALAHVRSVFEGFEVELLDLAEGARRGSTRPSPRSSWRRSADGAPEVRLTDVARFSALGVPAVNYGPGDPMLAHHDEERVPLAQIEAVERGLRRG